MSVSMVTTISKILPDGNPKENLRRLFYHHLYNNYALNGLIKKIDLLHDGTIFLKLNNGLVFHVPFWDAVWQLREHFILYEKYHVFKEGDTIVDAGANVGIFTIKAAKTVGAQGVVIAIEPSLDNLKFLETNIKLNDLKNTIVVRKGLWNKKGRKKLYLSYMPGSHSLIYRENIDRFSEIEVDKLDSIVKETGIKKVDFIKMDIEGAEVEALEGARQILRNDDLKMIIELHGNPIQKVMALTRNLAPGSTFMFQNYKLVNNVKTRRETELW